MRRLIAWTYSKFLGLCIKTHAHHIADLEQILSDLLKTRDALDLEIISTTRQLLDAHAARAEIARRRHEHFDTSLIDRQFPDVSPRSY